MNVKVVTIVILMLRVKIQLVLINVFVKTDTVEMGYHALVNILALRLSKLN